MQVSHLALRVGGAPRTIDDLAHATAAVLRRCGFDGGACFVGHSYGTFAVSRLRQLFPEVQPPALLRPATAISVNSLRRHDLSHRIVR